MLEGDFWEGAALFQAAQVPSPLKISTVEEEKTKGRGVILCRAVPGGCLYNAGFWKGEEGVLTAGGNF